MGEQINLRWYVLEWDTSNPYDKWADPRIVQSEPVLQYETEYGWKPVPTIIERINNERSEDCSSNSTTN